MKEIHTLVCFKLATMFTLGCLVTNRKQCWIFQRLLGRQHFIDKDLGLNYSCCRKRTTPFIAMFYVVSEFTDVNVIYQARKAREVYSLIWPITNKFISLQCLYAILLITRTFKFISFIILRR